MIKLVTEIWDIEEFEAWSGGYDTLQEVIVEGKTRELQELIEDMCYDTWTDTELNDFLWFDREYIYECLDIEY